MPSEVNQFLEEAIPQFTEQLAEFEMSIEPLAPPDDDGDLAVLDSIMQFGMTACRGVHEAIGGDRDLRRSVQDRFREATAPWLNQSWIINRARTKPRGFPGDYQMLSAIYDGVPLSRGLGGYLDRWALQMTLGQAVSSRLQTAKSFLMQEFEKRSGTIDVLDIASGPGREFAGSRWNKSNCKIHLTCLDSDQGALEYVRRHVSKSASPNLTFQLHRHNAMKLRTAEALIEKFGRQDVIYSVGLADYLPDRVLIPMLRCWKESLKPGGCVYVAFKDTNRYDHIGYQWFMDWHFFQRDEQDCIRLLDEAGYDLGFLQCFRDSTGVILNYISRQPMPASPRIDRDQSAEICSMDYMKSRSHAFVNKTTSPR